MGLYCWVCLLARGCATGSDAIREEVMSVRRSGKPVVVSMGNMATSGAYLISGALRKDTNTIIALLLCHFVYFTASILNNW